MDREQLRKQASSRRSQVSVVEETVKPDVKWPCEFCGHVFTFEKSFMNHTCRERDRIEELRGPTGQAAYAHYSAWMKQKKRSVPPIETFGSSKLYTTFIKFAEYAQRTHIPNIPLFIQLMVEHDVSPMLWSRDQTYAMYLQWFDNAYPPEVQVLESLEKLSEIAIDYECVRADVFKQMPIGLLVQLIERRKLSPWFLLSSKVFRDHVGSLKQEDKARLQRAVNEGAMVNRIQQDQERFAFFNKLTREVGL